MRLKYSLPGFVLALLVVSCKPDLEGPAHKTEPLDLSHYVAVGDYLTAGFSNGGLTRESQLNSFPNILARQFALAGAPAGFEQPLFSGGNGTQTISLASIGANGIPVFNGNEEFNKFIQHACSTTPSTIYEQFSTSAAQTASIQNFGVPGLLLSQIRKPGLGNEDKVATPADFNPYFERMLPPGDNRTYVEAVSMANPTFFTLWIGTSNIINHALSGATCSPLPPLATFRSEVTVLLDSLSRTRKQANNRFMSTRKGVICNIPSVRDYGFNRLVNTASLEKQMQNQYGPSVNIWISRKERPGPETTYLTAKISFDDIILLKGLTALGEERTITVGGQPQVVRHGLSELSPLTNEEVLDAVEINNIEERIADFNREINRLTSGANLPYRGSVVVADMKGLFNDLKNGVNYNGVLYNMEPFTGGIMTLDLFSFTPRGQAFIANRIIQTLNSNDSGTRIPEVNVNDFPLLKTE